MNTFVGNPIASRIKAHKDFKDAVKGLLAATVNIEIISNELLLPEAAVSACVAEEVADILSSDYVEVLEKELRNKLVVSTLRQLKGD